MSAAIDPRLLEAFLAVGETLHFGRAAERLLMDQSALSRQVARLEAQVGTPLLLRSSRSVTLTDAGRTVLAIAHEVLTVAVRAGEAAQTRHAELAVRLHTLRAESDHIHRALSRFTRGRPNIAIHLTDGGEFDPAAAVQAGTVDIGILYDFARAPALRWTPLTSAEYGVFTSPGHRLAALPEVPWSALDGESTFVAPAFMPDDYNRFVRERWTAAGATVTERPAPSNRPMLILESLLAGTAIALLPRDSFPLQSGLAWQHLDPPWFVHYGIAWRADNTNPALHDLVHWLEGRRPDAGAGH